VRTKSVTVKTNVALDVTMSFELNETDPLEDVMPFSSSAVAFDQTPYTVTPSINFPEPSTTVTVAVALTYSELPIVRGHVRILILLMWSLFDAVGVMVKLRLLASLMAFDTELTTFTLALVVLIAATGHASVPSFSVLAIMVVQVVPPSVDIWISTSLDRLYDFHDIVLVVPGAHISPPFGETTVMDELAKVVVIELVTGAFVAVLKMENGLSLASVIDMSEIDVSRINKSSPTDSVLEIG
jgi:hypothetical protein